MDQNFGFFVPWSFVPHPIPVFPKNLSFKDRCYNVAFSILDAIFRYYSYLPEQDKLAKEYFGKVVDGLYPV
jgi:glucuronosyltransferase